jgi:hypothetical protein
MSAEDRPTLDGWEAHRDMQMRAHLSTTPAQRLRWLEDAIRFAAAAASRVQSTVDDGPAHRINRGT